MRWTHFLMLIVFSPLVTLLLAVLWLLGQIGCFDYEDFFIGIE